MSFLLEDSSTELEAKSAEIHRTPIHFAAESDSLDAVKLLLDKGVDVNCLDANESTPLHCAAESGAIKVVEFLINSTKADQNLTNKFGYTPVKMT